MSEPNITIIEQIEGCMYVVNKLLNEIICDNYIGKGSQKTTTRQALDEIDLFQKTTLFELRKAFE